MAFLREGGLPAARARPKRLVEKSIRYAGDIEPRREELFVAGTETALVSPVEAPLARARIVSPVNGAVIAIDPDIPMANQRVIVRAGGGARVLLASGEAAPALLLPPPARHPLRLVDASGRELDRVQISVRGIR